ncbi:MAG: hypothetical protein IID14_02865 [Candidatus Marinimicrobia bacterium]|nr:hypothetical protein [Candidatus Neomarinimicrobiota bacterium]
MICLSWPVDLLIAQTLDESSRHPLPSPADGLVAVKAAPWDDSFYYLDSHNLEILAADIHGTVHYRYGGWGSGVDALDLPWALAVAENSIFVLDQGRNQIIRLDPRLNPVAVTPLPDDRLPIAFVRDIRQRFWVLFEHRAGLYLFDDNGTVLDVVADETSGAAAVYHPTLLTATPTGIAVWDSVAEEVLGFHLSGNFHWRFPIKHGGPFLAMASLDASLFLVTEKEILLLNWEDRQLRLLPHSAGFIDLEVEETELYGLDPGGFLRVLHLNQ